MIRIKSMTKIVNLFGLFLGGCGYVSYSVLSY